MRHLIDKEGKIDNPNQRRNKLTQEKGTFTLTNKEKTPPYSVVQSYVVEWQLQVLELEK